MEEQKKDLPNQELPNPDKLTNQPVEQPKPLQKFKSWVGLSSQVRSTAYNDETNHLTVEFNNGGRYRYDGVPLETWQKLLLTSSIGRFINTDIKPKYEFKKLN